MILGVGLVVGWGLWWWGCLIFGVVWVTMVVVVVGVVVEVDLAMGLAVVVVFGSYGDRWEWFAICDGWL